MSDVQRVQDARMCACGRIGTDHGLIFDEVLAFGGGLPKCREFRPVPAEPALDPMRIRETYTAMCQRCGEPRADGQHGLGHCVVSDAEVPAETTYATYHGRLHENYKAVAAACEPPCSCASLRENGHGSYCFRCTLSPTESAIYERGGYMRLDEIQRLASSGHYADCLGPGGKPCTCAEKDTLPTKPRSPAAILGEALEHIRQGLLLLRAALETADRESYEWLLLKSAVDAAEAAEEHAVSVKSKAEARKTTAPDVG